MEREIKEVADMQRKRLKRVIDPFKSILSLDYSGYSKYLADRISEHGANLRDAKIYIYNLPWLAASCIPLAYLTKSLMIPGWYLGISLYTFLFTDLVYSDCYFCRPSPLRQQQVLLLNNQQT